MHTELWQENFIYIAATLMRKMKTNQMKSKLQQCGTDWKDSGKCAIVGFYVNIVVPSSLLWVSKSVLVFHIPHFVLK